MNQINLLNCKKTIPILQGKFETSSEPEYIPSHAILPLIKKKKKMHAFSKFH